MITCILNPIRGYASRNFVYVGNVFHQDGCMKCDDRYDMFTSNEKEYPTTVVSGMP